MAAVLTAASILQCPHGFPFTVLPSQQLFTVDGQFVLVGGDLTNAPITSCTVQVPCKNITSITVGLSATLEIGEDQVVLDTATGATNALVGWRVQSAGQLKMEAA